jgi:hypothetical protein
MAGAKRSRDPERHSMLRRYRDPRTGKWVRARHVATREEIAERYTEWQILGSEVRDVDPGERYFTPHNSSMEAGRREYSKGAPRVSASGPMIS